MSKELKSSSMKVQEFLSQNGQDFVVQEMPNSTRTASDAAESIGCTVSQIAKSLIFKHGETGKPVLVVASGSNMVCADKVKQATGITLTKADASFVRDKVGYAIGGVPPVAHNSSVHTILDQDLNQYSEIWAAAGTPNSVFKLNPQNLGQLTQGQWIDLAK
ncbi:YbaK/EbsC family protein [Vibrio neptunius]|uniref:YbaK/EbsC family protein n=1 Tax=Vibrio neptunius TaxID=170651 RepID=A0ABS3A4J3_9VIBR|nr:YbaK/EbsC family protein [Vibrio neptunius]MBN3494599.1 YbaK/EbsC family protein [Vibrio neptunius]MBN3517015.1 YbaK/EbsC family protein [Vibrio neptunius]MBN3551526.1 YbaK/EbsC family protein [Vibrio neptunius]MBN3579411.1 YbaK/EbsC family protein [Vibrio neptunius]MCH9873075.1 YbaK/EbsC family protein [Vibrio neptunius]